MERLLLRENEALDALGIGRTTLWRLLSSGELRSVRIGRARRIPAVAIQEWIDKQVAAEEERRASRAGRGTSDGGEPAA